VEADDQACENSHDMRPLPDLIKNQEKVSNKLNGIEFAHFLDGLDFVQ